MRKFSLKASLTLSQTKMQNNPSSNPHHTGSGTNLDFDKDPDPKFILVGIYLEKAPGSNKRPESRF